MRGVPDDRSNKTLFEIIYAAVEVSFLIIALLAGINLALALAGVYFGLFLKTEEEG